MDAGCTSCQCVAGSGWFGPSCTCRYYLINITLAMPAVEVLDDELALARFKRTLATDLAIAAGATTGQQVNIAVLSASERSDGQLAVSVRFAKDCPVSSLYSSTAQLASDAADGVVVRGISTPTIASLSSVQQAQQMATGSGSLATRSDVGLSAVGYLDLLATYRSFAALFGDSDSLLYKGAVSALINQSVQATAADPSGADSVSNPPRATDRFALSAQRLPTAYSSSSTGDSGNNGGGGGGKSSSSSSSSSVYAIAGSVCGVAVLLALGGALAYRSYKRRSSPSSSPRPSYFSSLPSGSPSSRPLPSPSRSRPITAKADRSGPPPPPPHIEISRYFDEDGHGSSSQSFEPSSGGSCNGASDAWAASSPAHGSGNAPPSPLLPPAAYVTRSISDSTVAYVQHGDDDSGPRHSQRRPAVVAAADSQRRSSNSSSKQLMPPPPPPQLDDDSDMPALELTPVHFTANPISTASTSTGTAADEEDTSLARPQSASTGRARLAGKSKPPKLHGATLSPSSAAFTTQPHSATATATATAASTPPPPPPPAAEVANTGTSSSGNQGSVSKPLARPPPVPPQFASKRPPPVPAAFRRN